MFGKGKETQEPSYKGKKAQEPSYFEIGLRGTVDEFRKANKTAQEKTDSDDYHTGADDQLALQKGAFQAFQEGDIGKVQIMLENLPEFRIYNYYSFEDGNIYPEYVLSQIIKGLDKPADIIDLALSGLSEEKRQGLLNDALLGALKKNKNEPILVAALLETGAEANFSAAGGFKGIALACAIENCQPLPIVKLLHDNGASFDDALFLMKVNKWGGEHIKALKDYREKVTGAPATIEVEPEIMQQLLAQVAELTERVGALAEEVKGLKPALHKKSTAPKKLPTTHL